MNDKQQNFIHNHLNEKMQTNNRGKDDGFISIPRTTLLLPCLLFMGIIEKQAGKVYFVFQFKTN